MTADLTKGSPLKQIFLFSIPFLIGNLFQQFYNIADMVIVGRTLDPLAYAAVGATGGLVWFASGAIQALTTGFSVITARFFGAGDEENIKRSFAASIKLSAIITIIFSVICVIFARPILEIMQTPADIIDRSYKYFLWVCIGLIATALFNLLSNMIRALGDSKTPLYFLVIACLINIALDYVFIAVFGMDTDGAGLATVVAQLVSGLLCIIFIIKKKPLLWVSRGDFEANAIMDRALLSIGVPMAFLNMVLSIGSIVMQFVTNGLGTLYVSAQTTGSKIETFVTQPLLSLGSSASVFAAQNYGAKKYARVIDGTKKTAFMGAIWCAIASVIMLPFGKAFVRLLAGNVEGDIIQNAYLYLIVATLLSFIVSPLIIYKQILQAVGRTFWSMISGFTEILGRAGMSVVVIILLNAGTVDKPAGFVLMCLAEPAAWAFGLLTVIFDYIFMVKEFKGLELQTK